MDISVVIPAYNEAEYIGKCLDSLKYSLDKSGLSYELIVINNGSSDSTQSLAVSCGATVYSIDRTSVSAARNFGAKNSQGEVLAFIDADVIVTQKWADAAFKFLKKEKKGCVTGCQYLVESSASWIEKNWFSNLNSKYINGGNLILHRDDFLAVGGFDEGLKTGEDFEFCIRAVERRCTVILNSDFEALHLGYPKTITRFFKREVWHGEGDFKNFSAFISSKVAIVSVVFFLINVAALTFLISGHAIDALKLFFFAIAINCIVVFVKFRRCRILTMVFNAPINYVYLLARGVSFFRSVKNRSIKY